MTVYINFIFLGIYFTLSLYHFLIWIGRKEDLTNLAYCLLGLSFIPMLIICETLYFFIPNYDRHWIDIPTVIGVVGATTFFLSVSFDVRRCNKIIKPYLAFLTVFGIVAQILFNKYNIFLTRKLFYAFVGCYGVLYSIFAVTEIIRKKQLKDKKKKITLIGFSPVMLSFILFSVFPGTGHYLPSYFVLYFNFIFMMFIFAFSIATSFNEEFRELKDLKKTLMDKVVSMTKELKETQESREIFFMNLAHEVKTPLMVTGNYLDNFLKKYKLSEEDEAIVLTKNFESLNRIIINYFDIEKMQKGEEIYNHNQLIDFSEFLSTKIPLFQELAKKKNILLRENIQKEIYLQIDPFAADRIVNNLLQNAVKFSTMGGEIFITLKNEDNKSIFSIKDCGLGIHKDQINNIFKPFYKASLGVKQSEGMGLGLAIVKHIMNSVYGRIIVSSEYMQGSTFICEFQKHEKEPEEVVRSLDGIIKNENIEEISINVPLFNPSKKTVLIVEDNIDLLLLITERLKQEYNVFFAKNGKKALEILNDKNIIIPDCIISDLRMDEVSGYELFDIVSSDNRLQDVPFIIMSARDDVLNMIRKGATSFIKKPFNIELLKIKVDNILLKNEKMKKNIQESILNDFKSFLLVKNKEVGLDLDEFNLNKKEKQIIKLVLDGKVNKEIASELNTTENSICVLLSRVYKKFNVGNKTELINSILK